MSVLEHPNITNQFRLFVLETLRTSLLGFHINIIIQHALLQKPCEFLSGSNCETDYKNYKTLCKGIEMKARGKLRAVHSSHCNPIVGFILARSPPPKTPPYHPLVLHKSQHFAHRGKERFSGNWNGMVWYGMVWCGVVWFGMEWHGQSLHSISYYISCHMSRLPPLPLYSCLGHLSLFIFLRFYCQQKEWANRSEN